VPPEGRDAVAEAASVLLPISWILLQPYWDLTSGGTSHGGMAMMVIYPDYLSFDGKPTSSEYSADLQERLLKYVVTRYGDSCW